MRDAGGIRYVCGGVGDEEREALNAFKPQANIEILLVTEKRGGYLAGVSLQVSRAGSGAAPVHIEAEGPICLLNAPAGTYRVEATYDGVKRTRNVTASGTRAKPVVLAFPEDASDGVQATEDEKRRR